MTQNLIAFGFKNDEEVLQAVAIAKAAGFADWNTDTGRNILEHVIGWRHVVVDGDGDVLLGNGAPEVTESLERWETLVKELAQKIL